MPAKITDSDRKILKAFGARLLEARTAAGLSQAKLGELVGLSRGSAPATIAGYEHGRAHVSIARALTLADALGVDPAALILGRSDFEPKIQDPTTAPERHPEPSEPDPDSAAAQRLADRYGDVKARVEDDGPVRAVVCSRSMEARLPLGRLSLGEAVARCGRALSEIPRPRP